MMESRKQRSVDASRFAMVPRTNVPRSAHDVVTTHKTTFDCGSLIPVYIDEVLPGDTMKVNMTAFARLATPIVPVMDNLYLESFFFFVPCRLLWEHWEQFMGEQDSPTDTAEYLTPYVEVPGSATTPGTLYDYMGVHVNGMSGGVELRVQSMPFRAYNLIWNDFFRDQDLQDKAYVEQGDGPDAHVDFTLLPRGKRHDYFTTCRPWPQKPVLLAEMPGGGVDPVHGGAPYVPGGRMLWPQSGAPVSGLGIAVGSGGLTGSQDVLTPGWRQVEMDPVYDSTTTPFYMKSRGQFPDVRVLINDIRTANAVQLMMEQNARGGTRYSEIVRAHFGVTSPDARLQRAEYLGGGRANVTVSPIAQTSASGVAGTTTVLGELSGVGTVVAQNHGFSQSFTEHGWIIGLVHVRADLTYPQGLARMWSRRTQYDFYWPGLANLGEQAVLSREIHADGTAADTDVFGYQERWAEYRHKPGRISGRFRSDALQSLDMWHFAQYYAVRPVLNAAFIADNPPLDRVLQVGGADFEQFLFDSVFECRLVRPMPMFSIPGLGPRL